MSHISVSIIGSQNDVTRGLMRFAGAICAAGGARQIRGAPPGSGSDSPLGGRAVRNFQLVGARTETRRQTAHRQYGARGGLSGVPAIVPFGGAGGFMWAHSVNVCGQRHRLCAHLRATADLILVVCVVSVQSNW